MLTPGPLVQAMRRGAVLLIDELNLAPPAVTSMLGPLLGGATAFVNPLTGQVEAAAPGFCIIATGNSAAYAGRHALPASLRSRFQV
jgi:MoxR-like ATPase